LFGKLLKTICSPFQIYWQTSKKAKHLHRTAKRNVLRPKIITFSNCRAFRKEIVSNFTLKGGETFGAEILVTAKKKGLTIGELKYDPPPRRKNPRIGGTIKANLRILWALLKALAIYLQ
jgi:hypothetical protein